MVDNILGNSIRPGESSEIEQRHKQIIHRFIKKMPRLSTTVAKVYEICNGPDAAASDLNRVISYDPVLTGQLLRLINSAYYGLPSRVTSLTRAIIMLGINTVKNMVLATSVLTTFKGKTKIAGMSIEDFWTHCLGVGVIAKTIATQLKLPVNKQEEFFVAGLMHDLGKIPLMTCFPERYQKAIEMAKTAHFFLPQSEQLYMGIDHCQVGYLIGAKWKLDNRIQTAIVRHHEAAKDSDGIDIPIWCATGLANQLSKTLSIGFAGDADIDAELAGQMADAAGIDYTTFAQKKSDIEAEIEKAKIFLQVAA
jgi:putative nucleotidyltransferase with HDIG domain